MPQSPFTRRRLLLGAASLSVVGGAALIWRAAVPRVAPARLMVAESPAVASALFYVARDQGYFADQNLDVETIKANSGKEALEIVAAGKADLAMAAEAPFVRALAAGVPAQIVATVETSERNTGIILPHASTIRTPSDLKGKRIGFCPGTASEYFLAIFLQTSGLADGDIHRVTVTPKSAHEALASGEVDALSGWQEIRAHADKALGHRTRIFYADGTYLETWNLIGMTTFLEARSDVVQRFVQALLQAQRFAAANPEKAMTITSEAIGIDRATIAEMWPDFAFDLSLDEALIANLEGHWRMATKTGGATEMPDFLADLAPAALKAAAPSRVTYLR
jgi:NitT/TauT family transport system substrate-binding protein